MKYLLIIIAMLNQLSMLNSQVIELDMNSIRQQYQSYVALNDSVIKSIFIGKYYEQTFIDNSVEKKHTYPNIININDFTFKYMPFCSIKLKEHKGDTLFCELFLDTYQFPYRIFIYKDNEIDMIMNGVSGALIINPINHISKKTFSCIKNDMNHIVLNVCNIDSYFILRIDTENNNVNSYFCPNDLSKGTIHIQDNIVDQYIFNKLLQLLEKNICIPETIYKTRRGLDLRE